MASGERNFAGQNRSKIWTYLILGGVLLIGAIVANVAFSNPDLAKNGAHKFLGLPSWALAAVTAVVGAGIYWLGLKVETDWPEFVGSFLMTASLVAVEFMVGWSTFEFGGLVVMPYVLPLALFGILIVIGMQKSV